MRRREGENKKNYAPFLFHSRGEGDQQPEKNYLFVTENLLHKIFLCEVN